MDGVSAIDWQRVAADLAPIECIAARAVLRTKSRDFFWYSPVLNEQLKGDRRPRGLPRQRGRGRAHGGLLPRASHSRDAARRRHRQLRPGHAARGRHRARAVRGSNRVRWLKHGVAAGRGRAEADRPRAPQPAAGLGAALPSLDAAHRHDRRLHRRRLGRASARSPGACCATAATCSALRLVTMEAEPRVHRIARRRRQQAIHAYGTNGIITELEMPLAPAWPLGRGGRGLRRHRRPLPLRRRAGARRRRSSRSWSSSSPRRSPRNTSAPSLRPCPAGEAVAICVVAEPSLEAVRAARRESGRHDRAPSATLRRRRQSAALRVHLEPHDPAGAEGRPHDHLPADACSPAPTSRARSRAMMATFGDEVPMHLEFVRLGGHVACFGLQLVRYTDERAPRRDHPLMHEAAGCPVVQPAHLHAGGRRHEDTSTRPSSPSSARPTRWACSIPAR